MQEAYDDLIRRAKGFLDQHEYDTLEQDAEYQRMTNHIKSLGVAL